MSGSAAEIAHKHGALLVFVFTEAVSLGLLEPPHDADIVAGELQSFAISPSYGGPFAGIIATKEKFMRQLPGRLVGETTDTRGNRAFCLTLATREQHIRREKATSNICTNQALIALMATVFMTVYGKEGLRELAEQNLAKAHYLAGKLKRRFSGPFFNEFVAVTNGRTPDQVNKALLDKKIIGGLPLERFYPELDNAMLLCATEMTRREKLDAVAEAFARMIKKVRQHITQNEPLLFERSSPGKSGYQLPPLDVPAVDPAAVLGAANTRAEIEGFPGSQRSGSDPPLHAPVHLELRHRSGPVSAGLLHHEIQSARERTGGADRRPGLGASLSAGIALAGHAGSDGRRSNGCWPKSPAWMHVTLQPAAGAHGEFTGILLIRALLESRGNPRKKILIPDSAHGTNPATATMAGYKVENINSNERGMVDVEQLARLVDEDVAALMVTNPNTLGVFEENITKIAAILHTKGAMVYMDGANMNALVGIARPGDFGVDVMHLNLHKTFSTPHGGGGPGSGPVAVKEPLEPFLPKPQAAESRGAMDLELRSAAIHRPRAGVLRQLRRAGAGAGLHHGARRRRPAQRHPGCGAQRQLHPRN